LPDLGVVSHLADLIPGVLVVAEAEHGLIEVLKTAFLAETSANRSWLAS
jgi:hypothetical protein